MIASQFVRDLLDLLLDEDLPDVQLVRSQADLVDVSQVEYSGAGVFYYFRHPSGVHDRSSENQLAVFDGVVITSPYLTLEAMAILHCKNGLMDYLEVWCHTGAYPEFELEEYVMKQSWKGSKARRIERAS